MPLSCWVACRDTQRMAAAILASISARGLMRCCCCCHCEAGIGPRGRCVACSAVSAAPAPPTEVEASKHWQRCAWHACGHARTQRGHHNLTKSDVAQCKGLCTAWAQLRAGNAESAALGAPHDHTCQAEGGSTARRCAWRAARPRARAARRAQPWARRPPWAPGWLPMWPGSARWPWPRLPRPSPAPRACPVGAPSAASCKSEAGNGVPACTALCMLPGDQHQSCLHSSSNPLEHVCALLKMPPCSARQQQESVLVS